MAPLSASQARQRATDGLRASCLQFLLPFYRETAITKPMTPRALYPLLLLTFLAIPFSVFAENERLHILWETVSPDGKYAIGWTTTDETDYLADPTDDPNPVSNWVIEIATSKKLFELPDLHFSQLKTEHLDHYLLDSAWSANSRYLVVVLNQHFSLHTTSLTVLLADMVTRKALNSVDSITKKISAKFKDYDGPEFENPRFATVDMFCLEDTLGGEPYDFYFRFADGGKVLKLESAIHSGPSGGTMDTTLNRDYRRLYGLLPSDQQKALLAEERAWLEQRDAIKSPKEKDAFVSARCAELEERAHKIIDEKSD